MTGDLLKIELRDGTDYSSTSVVEFLPPLLDEFLTDYPELPLLLQGDSGFAKPELYGQCETHRVSYVIRLRENSTLRALASDQLIHRYMFLVTNMDSAPEELIRFYCKRGSMENFIKESKNGFDFAAVSSASKTVNANRLQIHALAYSIFNWFKRLALPAKMRKQQIDTICLKLLKIAARAVHSARYITFKLCSSCPYKDEFYETLENIRGFQLQLE